MDIYFLFLTSKTSKIEIKRINYKYKDSLMRKSRVSHKLSQVYKTGKSQMNNNNNKQ